MSTDHDFAAQPLDDLDRIILDTVADVFRAADPVPEGLTEDIKFALTVQAMHAEVAELQRVGAESALARSEYTQTQTLTFSAETLSVMVTISPIDSEEVRVDGWVTGHGSPVRVELRAGARTVGALVDDDGRFTLDPAPRGLVRFVFLPEGDVRPVITPAVEI
ncbi:MAG: hypothetical protein ACJ72B_08140 [Ornithinibacter sp.]